MDAIKSSTPVCASPDDGKPVTQRAVAVGPMLWVVATLCTPTSFFVPTGAVSFAHSLTFDTGAWGNIWEKEAEGDDRVSTSPVEEPCRPDAWRRTTRKNDGNLYQGK